LHTFLGIRLETVLDVGGGELAPIERRHVLPLHALPQLEGPDAIVGTRRPRLCEVALEPHVDGAARLVGKYIADEAVAGEAGELVEPNRTGDPRLEHRRGRHGSAPRGCAPPR